MAHFALHAQDAPLRARDIAEEVNIPIFYLSKILRRMVNAKLLTGSKGHGGGFLIAKAPQKITFAQILQAIEGDVVRRRCVFGWDACSDKTPCILHNRWRSLRGSFEEWAKKTTLADVQSDARKLKGLDLMCTNSPSRNEPLRRRVRTALK
jgi:Rrf2 family transcriptional regulator, iron-sulfur cluster assembly transcription factor